MVRLLAAGCGWLGQSGADSGGERRQTRAQAKTARGRSVASSGGARAALSAEFVTTDSSMAVSRIPGYPDILERALALLTEMLMASRRLSA